MIRAFGGSFLPSRLTLALIAASGLALAATQVAAQDTVIIGGGRPAVEVNLDALNDLGPGPRVRRLRMPGETAPAGGAIVLRPPGGVAIARTTPPPSLRPPPPAQTARPPVQVTQPAAPTPPPQAARPAPPPAPATTETARVAPPPAAPRRDAPPPPPPAAVETTVAPPPPPAPARVEPAPPPRVAPPPPPRAQIAAVEEEPVAAPQQRETETAAVAPRAALPEGGGQALRVVFSGASTRLTNDATARLDQLADALLETEDRIQLKAFAGGSADRPSTARRLSLSRALSVRSHLIERGLRSTRIDVRALGVPGDGGPNDRVDVILLTQ